MTFKTFKTFKTYKDCKNFLYENPNFTGVLVILHPNGRKWFEYQLVNGKKHGKMVGWYENGQKTREYNFVDDFQIGIQLHDGTTYEAKPEENNIWYIFVKETI